MILYRFEESALRAIAGSFLISMILVFGACSSNIEPDPETWFYGVVAFHGQVYQFTTFECRVSGTEGGPVQYSLKVTMRDDQDRRLEFSIQDPNNDPDALLTVGEHLATGQHWDGVGNYISNNSFYLNCLAGEQMSVVWEEIELTENAFSGRGYIHIKQRLEFV